MKLSVRLRTLFVPLLLGAAALAAGCGQGVGDRCQIDTDCDDGLVCSLADMTCQSPVTASLDGGGLPDAFSHVDANLTPDAAPAIDAPAVDAAIVDAPVIDAAPGDAAAGDAASGGRHVSPPSPRHLAGK